MGGFEMLSGGMVMGVDRKGSRGGVGVASVVAATAIGSDPVGGAA
ncbi:hypothetical protein [Rhodococcus sp. 05-339-2]|nr:hypothetical protein [Rhodococcus sp. 05-339-2]